MAPTPRRRWSRSAAAARLVLGLVLLLTAVGPTGASLFKRKRSKEGLEQSGGVPAGKGSKGGKGGKRGKVGLPCVMGKARIPDSFWSVSTRLCCVSVYES